VIAEIPLAFQWNPQTRIRSDTAIDRFIALPRATANELSPVGLRFSDVEEE